MHLKIHFGAQAQKKKKKTFCHVCFLFLSGFHNDTGDHGYKGGLHIMGETLGAPNLVLDTHAKMLDVRLYYLIISTAG